MIQFGASLVSRHVPYMPSAALPSDVVEVVHKLLDIEDVQTVAARNRLHRPDTTFKDREIVLVVPRMCMNNKGTHCVAMPLVGVVVRN